MNPFTLQWAATAAGGQLTGGAEAYAYGVQCDSRTVDAGDLFIALPGERADGHQFLADAAARGAAGAIVSHGCNVDIPQILVAGTLKALGDLAHEYRLQFQIPLVGITGSVGKTSTREMVAAAMRTGLNTISSEGNYNTEIGVPLTLFRIGFDTEAAVIEMAMRGKGEIDRLAEIAAPTVGLITNIGVSHVELLGSQQAIAAAKAELIVRLSSGGAAVLPADDPYFAYLQSQVPATCRTVTFADSPQCSADVTRLQSNREGFHVRVESKEFHVPLKVTGSHHERNALAALAVAVSLELPIAPVCASLGEWTGVDGRMQIKRSTGGVTIIDDCYNAAPESMAAGLEALSAVPQRHRVAVLGDMRELGELSESAHRDVGRLVAAAQVHLLITVGDFGRLIAEEAQSGAQAPGRQASEALHFTTTGEAADAIPGLVHKGDTVLVKGSRAMEMEHIVAALEDRPVHAHST